MDEILLHGDLRPLPRSDTKPDGDADAEPDGDGDADADGTAPSHADGAASSHAAADGTAPSHADGVASSHAAADVNPADLRRRAAARLAVHVRPAKSVGQVWRVVHDPRRPLPGHVRRVPAVHRHSAKQRVHVRSAGRVGQVRRVVDDAGGLLRQVVRALLIKNACFWYEAILCSKKRVATHPFPLRQRLHDKKGSKRK